MDSKEILSSFPQLKGVQRKDEQGYTVWQPNSGDKVDGKLAKISDKYLKITHARVFQDGAFFGARDIKIPINSKLKSKLKDKDITEKKAICISCVADGEYKVKGRLLTKSESDEVIFK